MIMGKAIVASDLDQIGRVLGESVRASALPDAPPGAEERRLAVLARPDSLDDLVEGMRFVITNRDWRATLGANARSEALKKYLWEHHVKAILDRIPGAV
jgi:glycosyltransferase involved in cell wall biosynthesis